MDHLPNRKKRKWIVASILAACVLAAGAVLFHLIRRPQPNVIVILVDTLRADHLGYNGYARNTSPILDAFARKNLNFKYGMTAAPWTAPSVASLFTGLYPTSHGWKLAAKRGNQVSKLSDQLTTLAELLQKDGYATSAVVSNAWISSQFGYDQGFESFVMKPRIKANQVNSLAMKAIRQLKKEKKPFFLYLHYLDPHEPYVPPKTFKDMFTDAPPGDYPKEVHQDMNLYDAEIRYLDTSIGKLFTFLKKEKLYDDSVIIFVADHGQQFLEHGDIGHGYQLYNEELNIPFIVKAPKSTRVGMVESTVSLIDIMPTVLSFSGITPPANLPGVNLLDQAAIEKRIGVMSEVKRDFYQRAFITVDGTKLIFGTPKKTKNPTDSSMEVVGIYNFRNDIRERHPLEDESIAALRKSLDTTLKLATDQTVKQSAPDVRMNESTVRNLKSMGYLK